MIVAAIDAAAVAVAVVVGVILAMGSASRVMKILRDGCFVAAKGLHAEQAGKEKEEKVVINIQYV